MNKVYAVIEPDYEGIHVVAVYTDEALAEAHAALSGCWEVSDWEVRTTVPRRYEWFVASAHAVNDGEVQVSVSSIYDITDDPMFNLPWNEASTFPTTVPNPGYIRDTPNARVPDTPGGRFLSATGYQARAYGWSADGLAERATALLEGLR